MTDWLRLERTSGTGYFNNLVHMKENRGRVTRSRNLTVDFLNIGTEDVVETQHCIIVQQGAPISVWDLEVEGRISWSGETPALIKFSTNATSIKVSVVDQVGVSGIRLLDSYVSWEKKNIVLNEVFQCDPIFGYHDSYPVEIQVTADPLISSEDTAYCTLQVELDDNVQIVKVHQGFAYIIDMSDINLAADETQGSFHVVTGEDAVVEFDTLYK